ncbi:hypothetical protein HPP92_020421 [Vanilla planifolia]|uniref:Uncharacterized protein n=1 Tax=Vanilla planifolia TaxID=51239 RepID=A0A835PX13_VANPL|nr:hypothetical protein HPP92_020421 [Vanilla planifolia]
MGRNLEIAEDFLISVKKNGNLPEKKKKRKKDKKFEECDQSRRLGENESHSKEIAKTLECFRGTKEKSKKRKLTEVELSANQIPESNGKHLDTDENKEIKAEQKRRKGNKSSFPGELNLESLEKRDENKRKDEKIREVREEFGVNGVFVTGNNVKDSKYKPLASFAESGLPAEVLNCCKTFSKPSPIQAHAWPFLLDDRDFIGIASTGSGKTLAFGVPALMHVLAKDNKKKFTKAVPRCLVLSPTRELAQQIADVLQDAGSACGITTVCVYGGTSKGHRYLHSKLELT